MFLCVKNKKLQLLQEAIHPYKQINTNHQSLQFTGLSN